MPSPIRWDLGNRAGRLIHSGHSGARQPPCQGPRRPRDNRRRRPLGVTGGKTRREYMFSGLLQLADIVMSAFQPQLRIARSGPSNSMLGSPPTTPQDYPERTGFAARRERECGHRRHCADAAATPSSVSYSIKPKHRHLLRRCRF